MMTNYDLIEKAKELKIPLVGVYSKDELPYRVIKGAYILNLEDGNDLYGNFNEGTHWTCFYIEGNRSVYFDSFGFIMPRQVQEFLRLYKPIVYNTKQIQSVKSQVCGWYCLYFLYWMSRQKQIQPLSRRLEIFNKQFDDDTDRNETLLKKYFKSL